jgi:hypothetical protein
MITHARCCGGCVGAGGVASVQPELHSDRASGVRCISTAAARMVLLGGMQDTTSNIDQQPAIAALHHQQLPRKGNRLFADQATPNFMRCMRDPTSHLLCCHCCMTAVSGTRYHALEWFIDIVHGCPKHMHERCWVYQEAHAMLLYQLIKLALLVCMQQQQAHGASQA